MEDRVFNDQIISSVPFPLNRRKRFKSLKKSALHERKRGDDCTDATVKCRNAVHKLLKKIAIQDHNEIVFIFPDPIRHDLTKRTEPIRPRLLHQKDNATKGLLHRNFRHRYFHIPGKR